MQIYLMQHGVALTTEENAERPLSPSGEAEVEQVAKRAAACGVRIGRCIHSGKLRAEQTAEVLAGLLGASVESRDGLNPSGPVPPIADWLRKQAGSAPPDSSIALVGHLPFLDRLAGVLIVGDQDAHPIRFHNAGLVKLVPIQDGSRYTVDWILTPDLAG